MKYLVVYNPFSRSGLSDKDISYIKKRLEGNELDFFRTQGQGSITKHVEKVGNTYDVIISCGGDGTLHETICGVMKLESLPKIAILPRGTMNDVSKSFGYSKKIEESFDIILKGNTIKKNVYSINDTYFLYGLAIGRYTNVSYQTVNKRQFGKFTYYLSCLKEFFKSKPIQVKINNEDLKLSQLFILNTSYLAGYKMDKEEDSHLYVKYILAKNRFIDTIRFYKFLKSRGKKCSKTLILDSIEIKSNELAYTLDGEKYVADLAKIKPLYNYLEFICK